MYLQQEDSYLDYGLDYTAYLETGESLVSVSVEATPSGLTLSAPTIDGSIAYCWVSEGEVGEAYRVAFTVETSRGAIDSRTLLIHIVPNRF